MDFKYNSGDVIVGLKPLHIVDNFLLSLDGVDIIVENTNLKKQQYLLRIKDFSFYLDQKIIDNKDLFILKEDYKQYNSFGDIIKLRSPHNYLREYSIEDISGSGLTDTFITLKLKACD